MANSSNPLENGPYAAMTLASIAYVSENDPTQQKSQMSAALSAAPASADGPWTLEWGPSNNDGNLVYVALNASGTCYAVAIRGTVEDDATGFVTNAIEDLYTLGLVPWLYPQSVAGAQIAAGTNIALAQIIAMTDPDTDVGLLDFMRGALAGSGAEVIVTGHSLGGCLTTVVAPWLYDQLPKTGTVGPVAITPYTFAAPTAGNQAFVDFYTSVFPDSYRCVNTWDIIPLAWADLSTMINLYPPPGQSLWDYSESLYFVVRAVEAYLSQTYAQTNQQSGTDTFKGPALSASNSFAAEAEIQHATGVYLQHVTPP